VTLVEADVSHIPFLATHMRQADVEECAAFVRSPADALQYGLRCSLWALTALVNGEPHAMMGVAPRNMMAGEGVPWMLGTERVYDHARDLILHTPAILSEMHVSFNRLDNLVAASNERAIRFIRHAGFELSSDPVMVGGMMFVRFHKGAE
jgi:hypothetical protein